MKQKENYRSVILVYAGLCLILLFAGYGNKLVHPDFNNLMLDRFLSRNNKGSLSENDFVNYTFFFDKGIVLKGVDIIKDGLFSATDVAAAGWGYNYSEEGGAAKTPAEWIIRGGFTADVPEVPASLRHFYDPTQPPGSRYLTDIANAEIMGSLQKYALTNPHIDGVEWALGKPGDFSLDAQTHQYTWERGKRWITMALIEKDKYKRDEFMAKAWRSLGETLHMIADNGCPSHVRNDAHPSPVWNNNTWFGNPDPYEELVDMIRNEDPSMFISFASGTPDPGFVSAISGLKKAELIAHEMALYTNKNFVTNETISGKDRSGKQISQITHPSTPYGSPLLQQLTYERVDFAYVSPSGVRQCTDRYYFSDVVPVMCEPYVDIESVKSQAKALFPNIIEAGSRVIPLFIPKLQIEIKSAGNNLLKGRIKHMKDAEYPDEIKYQGEVTIQVKDNRYRIKKEAVVMATNGQFECNQLPGGQVDDVLTAFVDFGGIRVQSNEIVPTKVKENPAPAPAGSGASIDRIIIYVQVAFDKPFKCEQYTIEQSTWLDIESSGIPISSGTGSFKGSRRYGDYYVEVSGTVSDDELIEFKYKGKGSLGCREQEWDLVFKNIPRINKEVDNPGHATYQIRPYDYFSQSLGIDMAAHAPVFNVKETNMTDRNVSRGLMEVNWPRLVQGSTIPVSPLIQYSAIEISMYR